MDSAPSTSPELRSAGRLPSPASNVFRRIFNEGSGASGFTLIEIVISISLLVIIMTVAYSALAEIIRSKQILEDARDSRVTMNSIIGRFTRELQGATASSVLSLLPPESSNQKKYPPGACFYGETAKLENGFLGDSLTFLSAAGGQYLPDGGTHTGVVQLSYRMEHEKGAPQDAYTLMREELPYIKPAEKAYPKKIVFPIARNVISIAFRYYNGQSKQWSTKWGEDTRIKLPAIISYTVKIRSPKGRIDTFSSAVALKSSED